MTRLNVELATPNILPTEPVSSSTAARGDGDQLTVFDTHLRRAQTPESVIKPRPDATDSDQLTRPSAVARRPHRPSESVSVQRENRRRNELDEANDQDEHDEHDDRRDEAIKPLDSEHDVITTTESSGDRRHEELIELRLDDTRHDTEETVAAQVVSDEATAGATAELAVPAAHQGEPRRDGSRTSDIVGSELPSSESPSNGSPGDESAAEGLRSGRPTISYGNDILTGKDVTTEGPVIIDDVALVADEADAVTAANTAANTNVKTVPRDDETNDRQNHHGAVAVQRTRGDVPQSRSSDQADTEASGTSHGYHNAETSPETAKRPLDVDTSRQGTPQQDTSVQDRPRRQTATRPNPRYGPEPPAAHETSAVDATSPATRSTLVAALQAFTHDESGQQLASDSTSQAADEAAAAGGDTAGDARSRGNPQDVRAELPPQLRAQFGSRASGETARGDGLSNVQRARFVQRVGNAFRMASERGGVVRLRLSPVELGSLRLEIAMRDGVMTGRMEVETSQARSTVVDNLGMLRQRLAEHNVEIERFDVEVRDRGAGELPEQNDRSTAFGDHRQNNNARGNNAEGSDTAQDSHEPRMARRPDDDSQLNLVI